MRVRCVFLTTRKVALDMISVVSVCLYTVFQKKTGPFFSSYLCSDSYELHEDFQKYIGGVACCEYEINVSLFFINYSLLIFASLE